MRVIDFQEEREKRISKFPQVEWQYSLLFMSGMNEVDLLTFFNSYDSNNNDINEFDSELFDENGDRCLNSEHQCDRKITKIFQDRCKP